MEIVFLVVFCGFIVSLTKPKDFGSWAVKTFQFTVGSIIAIIVIALIWLQFVYGKSQSDSVIDEVSSASDTIIDWNDNSKNISAIECKKDSDCVDYSQPTNAEDEASPIKVAELTKPTDTQEIVDRSATVLQQQGYNITSASTGRTTVGIDGKEHDVRFINWDKQPVVGFTTRNNIKSIDDQKSLMADPTGSHAVIILDCGIYKNRLSGCVGVEDEYNYMSMPWFQEMIKAYKVPVLTADEDGRIRFPIILH